jgi:hypothetical protein
LGKSSTDIKTLCKIEDFFEVSVDYLLGRTNLKTMDFNLKSACDYIGLSDLSLEKIRFQNQNREEMYKFCLSEVLSNYYFECFVTSIEKIVSLKLNFMDEYHTNPNINFEPDKYYFWVNNNKNDEPPFDRLAEAEFKAEKAARLIINEVVKFVFERYKEIQKGISKSLLGNVKHINVENPIRFFNKITPITIVKILDNFYKDYLNDNNEAEKFRKDYNLFLSTGQAPSEDIKLAFSNIKQYGIEREYNKKKSKQ